MRLLAGMKRPSLPLWRVAVLASVCATVIAIAALPGSSAVAASTSHSLVVVTDDVAAGLDSAGSSAATNGTSEADFNTYDGLVSFPTTSSNGVLNPNFKVGPMGYKPELATSYSHVGNTWTFHLRKGVFAANGDEFTSADVVYTFARIDSLALSGSGVPYFLATTGGIFNGSGFSSTATSADKTLDGQVQAVGKWEVVFHLNKATPYFPGVLTTWFLQIYDSTAMKAHATASDPWSGVWANTHTAGFGAYSISSYSPSNQIVFKANPHYWQGKPQYTTVTEREVAQSSDRLAAVETGSADLAETLSPNELKSAASGGASVLGGYTNETIQLYMNYKEPVFDGAKGRLLREAVAAAVPYKEIIDSDYGNGEYAKAWNGLIPSNFKDYAAQTPLATNISKAKKLLAKAGYPGGKGLSKDGSALTLYYVTERAALLQPIAEQIQTSLKQAGIPIKLQPIDNAEYQTERAQAAVPMALADAQDSILPDAAYASLLSYVPSADGGLLDPQNYNNPAFNKLIEESATSGGVTRAKQLAQAQKILMQDLPSIPLAQTAADIAVKKGITGYLLRPDTVAVEWFYLK
jgi:peptide/nickel transport system substrate-binding protein